MKFLGSFAGSVALAALASAAPDPRFVRDQPMAPIYRDGWIDLNKNGVKDLYEDRAADVEARITDLLARMTVDEKIAQLVTLYGYPRVLKDELPQPAWDARGWKHGIGNIDEHINGNVGWHGDLPDPDNDLPYAQHTRAINEVQRWFIERTRLGIPADFTDEGIRGLMHSQATEFPAELAVASTWDVVLAGEIGRVIGREGRALGYTNVYSPVLDLGRDPRWGRVVETFGEDPFLAGEFGVAQVRAMQAERVVATLKHFAVYGIPIGGRDGDVRTDPQASWREVQTVQLVPFRRAIRDAGALGVMASYNDYNGVPIAANRLFLTDILRGEWGFRGYVVSDSGAIEDVEAKHRAAATKLDAVRRCLEAGLNVHTNFYPPEQYTALVRQLVDEGRLAETVLDRRARDVLRVKFWLGLFDQPYVAEPAAADTIVASPEHLALAARATRESLILLKNDGAALPLDRTRLKRVLVAGPLADDPHAWWSRYGPQRVKFITPLEGIRAKLGSGVEVRYARGVAAKDAAFPESDVIKEPPSAEVRAGIAEAVAAADGVDAIIAVLGETDELCRESVSRISLNLPGYQQELLEALSATGKPVVLALSNGRPLSINWAAKHVPAIVEMWFSGQDGGAALADVLVGDVNPSGRLPITFPKSVGQIPYAFPAHPAAQARDLGQVQGALYPFGFGLSYTTFAYENLRVTPAQQRAGGRITVTADVVNAGARAGTEVVQLYLRDDYSSVIGFERELRGFRRVPLAPGERRTVTFELTPADLELFDEHGNWIVEPGHFTVMVGASSEDIRLTSGFDILADGAASEKPASVAAPEDHR